MAKLLRKIVGCCLFAGLITGCASVKVIKGPDDGDKGVRFYRPKPYLLVTPADPTGRMVNMKLEYLPDFGEEYSAHVKGKASIALKDGWNLVGVNTKEAPKDKEEPPAKIEDIKLPPAVVAATNVPIGYYESVLGYNGNRKFLQGWRYIGMTALGGGSPEICRVPGHNPNCPSGGTRDNGCINGPLYGLVFFNGVMTFRQLDEIANNQLCPMYVNPAATAPAAGPAEPRTGVIPGGAPPQTGTSSGIAPLEPRPVPDAVLPPPSVPSPTTPPPGGSASLYRPAAPKVSTTRSPAALAALAAYNAKKAAAASAAPAPDLAGGASSSLDRNISRATTSPRP